MSKQYSTSELYKINSEYSWNGIIKIDSNKNDEKKKLYFTSYR